MHAVFRHSAGAAALMLLFAIGSPHAAELYLKTGMAQGEAAWIYGLHENTQIDRDRLAVLDIGFRDNPTDNLRLKYDYRTKHYADYDTIDHEEHRVKLYWTPRPSTEIYMDGSYAERGGRFYLRTQIIKPRWVRPVSGGTLKIGPTYRDRDFHDYDNFDSTAYGVESSFSRRGHFLKASALEQDAANDLYDRRTWKASWKWPLAKRGDHLFKGYAELRHRDYFAVDQADKTARATRVKLRAEWSRALGNGWKWRSRLQHSWRDSNLPATSYDDLYGEFMLIYQGSGRAENDGEGN